MPTTIRRTVTAVLAACLVAGAMLFPANPVAATVVERGQFSVSFSDGYDDCGFEVAVEGTATGRFRIRAGKGKTDTAFFLNETFSYTETHTNVQTGAFLTIKGHGVFNELRATRVEDNIFEFSAVEAGQPFVVYDSAGDLVLRDRGALHHHILFDTGGDDVPGGEFLVDLGTEVHGPHPGWETDFCDNITPLIGS